MHTAQFKSITPLASSKVDIESGIIRDVALMSVGVAHGSIDGKPMATEVTLDTLKTLYALLKDGTKKSHILHGDDHAPTNAIGIFSGFYLDVSSEPATLRASQFQAFKAFRENSKKEYETMFELAATSPKDMAMSADFDLDLEKRDGLPPIIVPLSVRSFDFVNEGAATNGLLEKEKLENQSRETLDIAKVKATQDALAETQSQQAALNKTSLHKMKAVFAHFAANPKALPFIAKFAAELPEDAKPEDVIAKVECALDAADQEALIAERDALKLKVTELEAKVAELSPKAENEAALSKENGELKTQVATLSKVTARFGARPIVTGKPEGTEVKKTATQAEFSAMTPAKKMEFSASGGRIAA